jgi:hypothetical protein
MMEKQVNSICLSITHSVIKSIIKFYNEFFIYCFYNRILKALYIIKRTPERDLLKNQIMSKKRKSEEIILILFIFSFIFQIEGAQNCLILQSTNIYGSKRSTFDQNLCFDVL